MEESPKADTPEDSGCRSLNGPARMEYGRADDPAACHCSNHPEKLVEVGKNRKPLPRSKLSEARPGYFQDGGRFSNISSRGFTKESSHGTR